MKKIYTLLGLLIAFFCCGLDANAQTVTVEVDNPSNFYIMFNSNYDMKLQAGSNTITAEEGQNNIMWINTAKDGIEIRLDDGEWTTEELAIRVNASNDGQTFRLSSRLQTVEETVTLSFDFNGHNPSEVISSITYCNEPVDAQYYQNGDNTFTLGDNSQHDFKVVMKPGYYFAAVKKNGSTVKFAKEGDDIVYNIKDVKKDTKVDFSYLTPIEVKKANFTFGYGTSNASSMIANFTYGDNLNQDTQVPASTYAIGTNEVTFIDPLENTYDLITYKLFDIATLNGTDIIPSDYYGSYHRYHFTLTGDDEVVFKMNDEVEQTKAKATFTFNYGKDSVTEYVQSFRYGYNTNDSGSGTVITEQAAAGTREIEFNYPSDKKFALILKKDMDIPFATINGEAIQASTWVVSSYKAFYFDVKDGDEIVFSVTDPSQAQIGKAKFTFDYDGKAKGDVILQLRKGCDVSKGTPLDGEQLTVPETGTYEYEFDYPSTVFSVICKSNISLKVATINGEPIEMGYFSSFSLPHYVFTVSDGDEVVLSMKEPEVPVTKAQVNFTFENEGYEALSNVYVGGSYDNMRGALNDGLTVNIGDQIRFSFNNYNYKDIVIKANDEEASYANGYYNVTINQDTEIVISAKLPETIDITVNIDDSENAIFKAYTDSYNTTSINLTNGDNNIQLKEVILSYYDAQKGVNLYLAGIKFEVAAQTDCEIISVTDEDGNDMWKPSSYSNYYFLKEGSKINITTKSNRPEVDNEFEVYMFLSNKSSVVFKDRYGYDLIANDDWEYEDLVEGYQNATYKESQNPFYISNATVYVNGEKENTRDITLADGDFVMIFGGSVTPTLHTVNIELPADVEAVVKKHHKEEVTELNGIEMFEGTELHIAPANDKQIWVYVPSQSAETPATARSIRAEGDDPKPEDYITSNEDGSYTVKVNEKTANLRVSNNDPTGISEIFGSIEGETEVYNLQGIRVNADKNLPAGIYIVNGKKVMLCK